MKIAFNHISRFFKDELSISDVSTKLFQLGHENEINGDILDIEFTPNRGDCLSLRGLARDLGAFFRVNLNVEVCNKTIDPFNINFTNHSPKDCPNIYFLNLEISDDIKSYQPYLESYFRDLGIKKNNFFTDVSNYLAYEIGQPTHCYDYHKIGNSLEFKSAIVEKEFHTLLNNKIKLDQKNSVFFSNSEVINLAGIMGGMSTACSQNTTSALIESAFFNPEAIIGKAVKYDLHSDSSYKFERGVDPGLQEIALRRFIKIVSDHVEITKLEIYGEQNYISRNELNNFDYKKINKILGTKIPQNDIEKSLSSIGFSVDGAKLIVPPHRNDINHINDIAEEVARVYGYDNLQPKKFILNNIVNLKKEKKEYLKEFLVDMGFNEVINNPFSIDDNRESISLDNPLDTNKGYLRTSLRPSLIKNLEFNENRQHDSIKLFEISEVYFKKNDDLESKKLVSIIISGREGHNHEDFSKKLDNKYILNLLKTINFNIDINQIKEIDRNEVQNKIKNKIYFIEININDIPDEISQYRTLRQNTNKKNIKKYQKISEYPSSLRDLSFLLSNEKLIIQLEELVLNYKSAYLKNAFIFDFYKKDKSNIKVGVRFTFQSLHSTLTDKDIDLEISKFLKKAKDLRGLSVPGL